MQEACCPFPQELNWKRGYIIQFDTRIRRICWVQIQPQMLGQGWMIKSWLFPPRLDGAIEGGPKYQKQKCKRETTKENSSFLSSAMRGDYTLEHCAYVIHHRGVILVELFGAPLDQYVGKDISHRTGLINLQPSRRGHLMDPQEV